MEQKQIKLPLINTSNFIKRADRIIKSKATLEQRKIDLQQLKNDVESLASCKYEIPKEVYEKINKAEIRLQELM